MSRSVPIKPSKRGSSATDKQIAYAVKHESRVAAFTHSGVTLRGYVVGADDYHWILIDENLRTILVHKSVPALLIETCTIGTEEKAPQIREATAKFRAFIMRTHFHDESGDSHAPAAL